MENKTVRLRTGRQGRYQSGHPWIYRSQLLKADLSIKPGSVVTVQASDGAFIGKGYFNPRSEIAARILTFQDEPVDAAFFDARIRSAFGKRESLAVKTNACRAVFSEADGLPGLIVDMYADTAVMQIMTLGMDMFRDEILQGIRAIVKPKYIYEKSDSPFRKPEGLKIREEWHGQPGPSTVEISEGKARFLVDIANGHKTGFYLDQRPSRMAMHTVSKGRSVLDLFCYTGAFAVHAALSGARDVLAVDIKEDWLELGRRNADLNGVAGAVTFAKGDSLDFLRNIHRSGRTFDMIIIDPPSFIKAKHSLATASKGYKDLNRTAMRCLNHSGVLATFSCSHYMPNDIFSRLLKEAAAEAGKNISILKRCHQAEDHPIVRAIPETEYLKGYFLKVVEREA